MGEDVQWETGPWGHACILGDVVQYRIAAGADLQHAFHVATLMEHAPAACRDLLKDVLLANRETYHTLRADVREWRTLGVKGKGQTGEGKKGKGKEQDKKDNDEAKGRTQTDASYGGECGYCGKWRHMLSAGKQKKHLGGKLLAATV